MNTLYVNPPASTAASLLLVLRIYVPTGTWPPPTGASFPSIVTESATGRVMAREGACATISSNGAAATWKRYARQSAAPGAASPAVAGAASPPIWSRSFGSQFGNPANAYLMTVAAHHHGQLVVIHARVPSFPNASAGQPVYGDHQVRYWSFCTYDSTGQAVIGCAADYRAVIRGGWVTYVVSDPARRPRNATAANGVTWLPWGPENAIQIVYRNMLPAQSYRHAVQQIANRRQSVRATMGAYYPTAAYCSTATFQRGGWRACLHERGRGSR